MNLKSGHTSKVLIIDHEPKGLTLLKNFLSGKGFQVITKQSGEEGIIFLQEHGPVSVIFSDFNLDGMNGLEFFKIAKIISPGSYRLLITSLHSIEDLLTQIEEKDIHYFLNKPYLLEEVLEHTKMGILHYEDKSSNK